jgi:pimeloyl-ACP methyl ester carboxylesterase
MFMRNNEAFDFKEVRYTERDIIISPQVTLHLLEFVTLNGQQNPPVIMIGGLSTLAESFRPLLEELSRNFHIYYIETREKGSSKVSGKVSFDIATMGKDIASAISKLDIPDKGYVVFGYSMGATIIVDVYPELHPAPLCLLLIEPTPSFRYPLWSQVLIRFAVPLYSVLKPIAKWYMRTFRITEDKVMYANFSRALDNADPAKLRDAILSNVRYKIWDKLNAIDCPVLVVSTSSDGMHEYDETMRLAREIKDSSFIDMKTNDRTHGAELAFVFQDFLRCLGERGINQEQVLKNGT